MCVCVSDSNSHPTTPQPSKRDRKARQSIERKADPVTLIARSLSRRKSSGQSKQRPSRRPKSPCARPGHLASTTDCASPYQPGSCGHSETIDRTLEKTRTACCYGIGSSRRPIAGVIGRVESQCSVFCNAMAEIESMQWLQCGYVLCHP